MAMKNIDGADILIVDNDPELAHVIAVRLARAGHRCVTANSGAQAISEWQRRSFDIVISDVNMPGGDGVALADTLQRSEAVPVIFITGFKHEFAKRLKHVKNVTVLEKPFDYAILLALVEATLAGSAVGDDGLRHRGSESEEDES
jgi:two-component system response regulator GlrR